MILDCYITYESTNAIAIQNQAAAHTPAAGEVVGDGGVAPLPAAADELVPRQERPPSAGHLADRVLPRQWRGNAGHPIGGGPMLQQKEPKCRRKKKRGERKLKLKT